MTKPGTELETLGSFTVASIGGRCSLYHGDIRIAECINFDYTDRHGDIRGWLKHVEKRSRKRMEYAQTQIAGFQIELKDLEVLTNQIQMETGDT